jgi:type VI secretion system protein ImpC
MIGSSDKQVDGKVRSGVETQISDRYEKELADLGFMPLLKNAGSDEATFFSVQSCAKARTYDKDAATANSRLSCQLQYVLTASRFMHYLKVIARGRVGSYHTRGDLERLLNSWISEYVAVDDQASPAIKAKRPLHEARIDVSERADKPGVYCAVAFLRPHFQLDELSVSLRLAIDLN